MPSKFKSCSLEYSGILKNIFDPQLVESGTCEYEGHCIPSHFYFSELLVGCLLFDTLLRHGIVIPEPVISCLF